MPSTPLAGSGSGDTPVWAKEPWNQHPDPRSQAYLSSSQALPTLSLSLPTVQGGILHQKESLGFLPAGVFCDPRAVFTWALDEQALTCPSWDPGKSEALLQNMGVPYPAVGPACKAGWRIRTCTHLMAEGPGQGCLQGPCSGGRGCEQSDPTLARPMDTPFLPASHPAPPSSTP